MSFFRRHIEIINKTALGAFTASWFMLAAMIPAQVAAMAESHTIFYIYNSEEGCYELMMDHHKDAGENHFSDTEEEHDLHSFHSSCCYDDYVVKFKKHDFDHALDFAQPVYELRTLFFQSTTPLEHSEHNLPPPATLDVLRVTRLLI